MAKSKTAKSESNGAFTLLADMAAQYQKTEVSLPVQALHEREWRGIGFRLGGHRFIAPQTEIDEVLYLPECTKVPGVRSWVNGVANVRGRLLSVVDMGLYFGGKASIASTTSRVLSIRAGDIYCGLIVDEVLGIQTFAESSYQAHQFKVEKFSPLVTGAYEKEGECWPVFGLYELAKAPAFLQVAV